MTLPKNVVRLRPASSQDEDDRYTAPNVLGMLHRKDFELWISRSPRGKVSLKWWRWREDLGRFCPLEEGELTLDCSELLPLADLLSSVDGLLGKNGNVQGS
jgi:hypothetical protein